MSGCATPIFIKLDDQNRPSSDPHPIGRIRNDSAIVQNIHLDMAALDSLMADIKKHPLRYVAF